MATQLGTQLKIGFATKTLTGYIMQAYSDESTAAQAEVLDEEGDTTTVVITNPGRRITGEAIIKESGGSLVPPLAGASLTIDSVIYRVESASVAYSVDAARLSFTAIKEDSMTYS